MEHRESSSSKSRPSEERRERPLFVPERDFYSYDLVEGRNTISERVRHARLDSALSTYKAPDRVLELGCGTGRDAVELAKHGIRVVATDVSP